MSDNYLSRLHMTLLVGCDTSVNYILLMVNVPIFLAIPLRANF